MFVSIARCELDGSGMGLSITVEILLENAFVFEDRACKDGIVEVKDPGVGIDLMQLPFDIGIG